MQGIKDTSSISTFAVLAIGFWRKKPFGSGRGIKMRTPMLAVDVVILFGKGIVLIRRQNPPYQGSYALPGGFVEIGERAEEAVQREAREETGLEIELLGLVGAYSDPRRDPRGHVVSLCYLARGRGELRSGSDARSAEVFSLQALPALAFDHQQMIDDALRLLKSAGERISLK